MLPLLLTDIAAAQTYPGSLTVRLGQSLHPMAKGFYGQMTEEINHAYDGGLYGELVANRALKDDPARLPHWTPVGGGTLALAAGPPGTKLSALRLGGGASAGAANDGYWGIPVRPNTVYRASLYVRGTGPLTVAIEGADGGKTYAQNGAEATEVWRKVELRLKTGAVAPTTAARFVVRPTRGVRLRIAGMSLFGPTFKNRPNGNRPDLMELMGAMQPRFLRLPGGNYLEGNTLAERFDWKKTIGPLESRPGHQGPWGYRSSDGLGLLEYLEWCEDLKMEPLLAVYAGYSLGGQHVEPGAALEPYVQDALDEIEFVSGDAKTEFGAVRAKLGHPKPFPLRYVEIGNEDWFDRSGSYDGRFAQFHDAIKARYPKLQTIATTGTKLRTPDVIDDHYYRTAAEMAGDAGHYDRANRKGPKVFVGEWATLEGDPTPNFQAALGDAAFLTGLERNSDHVVMESYAPLLVNVNPGARQWNTNLIGYDGLRAFGSPSYWVQVMFGQNAGDTVLPVEVDAAKGPETLAYRGGVGVAGSASYRDPGVAGQALPDAERWSVRGGSLTTSERGSFQLTGRSPIATAGNPAWTDETFSVKAIKTTAEGGFSLLFHFTDERNTFRWDVGGARNEIVHQEVFATKPVGRGKPVVVEPNRWVDLRLEVTGGHIRGYVDGNLAIEATEPAPQISPVYVSALQKGRETILKVVNFSATPSPLRLNLAGGKASSYTTSGSVLAGPLEAENTVAEPLKVAPRALPEGHLRVGEAYVFPAYSVTVLRLKPE